MIELWKNSISKGFPSISSSLLRSRRGRSPKTAPAAPRQAPGSDDGQPRALSRADRPRAATRLLRLDARHADLPWQERPQRAAVAGENAIHKAGALLTHLQTMPRRESASRADVLRSDEHHPHRRLHRRNVVPAKCELNLNYRFAGRTLDDAEREVQTLAAKFGAECKVTDRAPSGPVILDNPLLQEFRALTAAPVEAKQPGRRRAARRAGIPPPTSVLASRPRRTRRTRAAARGAGEAYRQLERFLKEAAT